MRIIVIDKNIDRRSDHRRNINENYPALARKVYKKCEIPEIQNFKNDILFIHYNNKQEADFLLSSKSIGRIRIFFTGEWNDEEIKKIGEDYLVGHDKLYSKDMIDIVMSSI